MTNNLIWPHHILGYKATVNDAKKLAREIVKIFGSDPLKWLEYGRFEVKEENEYAGGLQALCIPMDNDQFRFVIYDDQDHVEEHPLRRTFLILHEIAHTFFYIRTPNNRPIRAIASNRFGSNRHNEWEENFCDSFAKEVCGLSYKDVGLTKHEKE